MILSKISTLLVFGTSVFSTTGLAAPFPTEARPFCCTTSGRDDLGKPLLGASCEAFHNLEQHFD
jgi:hypothetical protein